MEVQRSATPSGTNNKAVLKPEHTIYEGRKACSEIGTLHLWESIGLFR